MIFYIFILFLFYFSYTFFILNKQDNLNILKKLCKNYVCHVIIYLKIFIINYIVNN
jgi:hypothetical protein